ncbi:UPF0262 family protein [Sinorhizobium fredii]|uniref:UPF0262 family protein n=1 Tax=Rhizobium fredii TaxID=380 RepID=UPI003513D616
MFAASTDPAVLPTSTARNQLCAVQVDHEQTRLDAVLEREQSVAIADLLEDNLFELIGRDSGPYKLRLSTRGAKLAFHIMTQCEVPIASHILSFTPFRRVLKDYAIICEAHLQAAIAADPHRIEAIDMGRRAIHNEGSEILRERLSAWIRTDRDTARRLFTLIAVPHTMTA